MENYLFIKSLVMMLQKIYLRIVNPLFIVNCKFLKSTIHALLIIKFGCQQIHKAILKLITQINDWRFSMLTLVIV